MNYENYTPVHPDIEAFRPVDLDDLLASRKSECADGSDDLREVSADGVQDLDAADDVADCSDAAALTDDGVQASIPASSQLLPDDADDDDSHVEAAAPAAYESDGKFVPNRYEDESPWANEEYPNEPHDAVQNERDTHWNKKLGKRGEDAAARFLERKGFEILERNWSCEIGEVDIIAEDEDSLHFVEVKTRSDVRKGFPTEAVDAEKRRKYEIMAALYLTKYHRIDLSVCFDIISILVTGENSALLRFHCNAFTGNVL